MDQIPVIVHPVPKEIIEIIETEDTTVLPTLNVITVLNVEDLVHLVIRIIGVIGIGTGIESMRGGGIVNVLLLNNTVIDLVEEGENTTILIVGIQDIGVEVEGGETIMEEEEGEGMRIEVHLEDTGEMIDDKEVGIEEEEGEEEVIEEEVEEEEGEEGEEGMDLLSKDSQIKAIGGIGVLHPKILSSLVNARDLSLHGMSNLTGLRVSLLNKLN